MQRKISNLFSRFAGQGKVLLFFLFVRLFELSAGILLAGFAIKWMVTGRADLKNGKILEAQDAPLLFAGYSLVVLCIGLLLIVYSVKRLRARV